MKKKFIVKIALIAFVVILVSMKLFFNPNNNFDPNFMKFSINEVTKFEIKLPSSEKTITVTKKEDNNWYVSNGEKTYNSDKSITANYLNKLKEIKPKHLASISKREWDEFQLTDSKAIRIKLFNNNNILLRDILIGKSNIKKPADPYGLNDAETETYVRSANERKVYIVDGLLQMHLSRDFDDWRNKLLTKLKKKDIKKISFVYPENSFTLNLKDSEWYCENKKLDNRKVEKYIAKIKFKYANKFSNSFQAVSDPKYQLIIEGDNHTKTIIKCYETEEIGKYIIHSDQNSEAFFETNENELVNLFFKSLNDFK
jgi:hypothetical protein